MYLGPSASITRPNNTTQYAQNQLVGNSVTAGSVTPFRFNCEPIMGRGRLFHARFWKSTSAVTAAKFNLHLYTQIPTPTNGDGGAYAVATTKFWFATIAVDMTTGNEVVSGVDISQQVDLNPGRVFDMVAEGQNDTTVSPFPILCLFGLLETQTGATYTPGAQEVFKICLGIEGFRG